MGFQCSNMLTALPSAFLDRLLSAALMEDAEIRLFVLEILISFIDRHDNRQKFSTIRCVPGDPQQGWGWQASQSRLWREICQAESACRLWGCWQGYYNLLPILGWSNAADEQPAKSQMGGGCL